MDNSQAPKKASFRAIISWFLYDWACSSFSIIIITFIFATYFTKSVATNTVIGTAQWGNAIAGASLVIALLSPICGAIADYEGRRKPWLLFFTLIAIITAALLWFVKPSPQYVSWALICVILGTIGLEMAAVFYNAMLSDITQKDYLGRFSGWAWGLGYFGGLACLTIALFAFVEGKISWLHLDKNTAQQIRICGPLVAIWFALFGWPLFAFTPDRPSTGLGYVNAVKQGIHLLKNTLTSILKYKDISNFLLARLFYIDGLNTIFAFGGIYAAGTFHMSFAEVIKFGIAMNIFAGIGAIVFAWLDDYKGSKITILISIALMVLTGLGMVLAHSKTLFWILGLGLSVCVGPIQAASRSLMIRIAPPELITEMFGLFTLSGKITAFMGPWVLAWVTLIFDSQRAGMSTVLFFLTFGGILLSRIKIHK